MRRSRKIGLWVTGAVVAVVIIAVVAGYWWQRPLLLTGTGYAAHNACALEHLAGRSSPETDLPENPLVPVLRGETTEDGARASVLGVLAAQHAWFTPGYGCTLAGEAPELPAPTQVDPAANPYTDAVAPEPPPAVVAALDEAFGEGLGQEAQDALGTRGIVVLQGGELVAERYADGFDADTPQLGWSMTKSLTNLLVGRLVAQGAVALSDDHLLEQWTDERSRITIADLLQMTSGLEWDETYDLGTPITRMLYLEPDMGGYVASLPLAHDPGTYQQYSSGSPTLLCSILAPQHGGADWPRQELFAPLGLSSMVLEPDAAGTPVCGSYAWATPRDWAALGQFALQEGEWNGEQLLPEGWMEQSTTAVDVAGEERGSGTAWWVNELPDGSLVHPELPADAYWAVGHDGQWLVIVPSADLVVARLGFTPQADEGVVELTAQLLAALG